MADIFKFEIVTPTGVILSEDVEEIYAPGEDGEFGVLKGHTELIGNLSTGIVSYKSGGSVKKIAVAGGYAEVWPDKVNLLVDMALMGADINASEANTELAAAEKALEDLSIDDPEYASNKATADFARAKIEAAGGK